MNNDYHVLQMQINDLIKKTGSVENTIKLLSSLLPEEGSNKEFSTLITFYVSNYIGISPDELIKSEGKRKVNSPYRMICYQLHKEILSLSIRRIGDIYDRKENAVMRGLHRMKEIIEKPVLDIETYNCFVYVKQNILKIKEYVKNK